MHLRIATTRDLPRLTQITITSLIDDKSCEYMWPHRLEYPEDNVFWWQLRLERHLYDKRTMFLVVEIDHAEEETAAENTIGPASKIMLMKFGSEQEGITQPKKDSQPRTHGSTYWTVSQVSLYTSSEPVVP